MCPSSVFLLSTAIQFDSQVSLSFSKKLSTCEYNKLKLKYTPFCLISFPIENMIFFLNGNLIAIGTGTLKVRRNYSWFFIRNTLPFHKIFLNITSQNFLPNILFFSQSFFSNHSPLPFKHLSIRKYTYLFL